MGWMVGQPSGCWEKNSPTLFGERTVHFNKNHHLWIPRKMIMETREKWGFKAERWLISYRSTGLAEIKLKTTGFINNQTIWVLLETFRKTSPLQIRPRRIRTVSDVTLISALTVHPWRRSLIKSRCKNRLEDRDFWEVDSVTNSLLKAFHEPHCSAPAHIHYTKALSSEKYFQPTIKWHIVFSLASSFWPSILLFMSFICGPLQHSIYIAPFTPLNYFSHPLKFFLLLTLFMLSFISYQPQKKRQRKIIFLCLLRFPFHLIALYSQLLSSFIWPFHIFLSYVFEKCHEFG